MIEAISHAADVFTRGNGNVRAGRSTRAARIAALLLAGFATAAASEPASRPLDPPVLLPDGTPFETWEASPEFSRTYYVDGALDQASDENPGTREAPFRTIQRAADVLQPGERVVIAAGVYRERVRPTRGGSGPTRMISYEAAPGADVIVRGSRVLSVPWVRAGEDQGSGLASTWRTTLPADLFADENPFHRVNLTPEQIDRCMPWAVPI